MELILKAFTVVFGFGTIAESDKDRAKIFGVCYCVNIVALVIINVI